MNDRLMALGLFVRVARAGSFSAAGRALGLSQPSASRIIAALEADIGIALFTRTTRAVALTDAGTQYLQRVEPILAALGEADHEARGTGELRGVLRVGISSSLGIRSVIPGLPAFMKRHPALRIELLMDDQLQELVTEGVDVALRFGSLRDSTATSRRIGTWPRLLAASPGYLAEAGMPASPAALAAHAVIIGPTGAAPTWSFRKDRRVVPVRVEARLMVTVNEGAIAAAVAGIGIVMATVASCREEIERGVLVRVLPDWDMGVIELHAVFTAGRAAKPAARAFADFLVQAVPWP